MNTRQLKVLRELWTNKTRTLLAILSIAIGVAAFGLVRSGRIILERDLSGDYAATDPAHAVLTVTPFGDDLVDEIRKAPGVRAIEARRNLDAKLETTPGQWATLQLQAIPNFAAVGLSRLIPAAITPPRASMLLERSTAQQFGFNSGQTAPVRLPNGRTYDLRVSGLINDLSQIPSTISSVAYGYISLDTLQLLGEPREYDQLYLLVDGNPQGRSEVERVVTSVIDRIEKAGYRVVNASVPQPNQPALGDSMTAVLLILELVGWVTLALSAFLILNVMWALMARQIREVGILKSLGSRTREIVFLYLEMVFVLGVLALLLAVPLGVVGSFFLTQGMSESMNFDIVSFNLPPETLALQAVGALLVPLLAASIPILSGSRMTIREAFSETRSDESMIVARLSRRLEGLPRLPLLSLRNTFRHPGRAVLTIAALTLAGAMFIATLGTRQSLRQAGIDLWAETNYDVEVDFSQPYSRNVIERIARETPGVVQAEAWGVGESRVILGNKELSASITLIGLPAATDLSHPDVRAGRWLVSDGAREIFVNADTLDLVPGVHAGDEVHLRIAGEDETWKLVGTGARGFTPVAYVDYAEFERSTGERGAAGRLVVKTAQGDSASEATVESDLLRRFAGEDMQVARSTTVAQDRENSIAQLDIIAVLLLAMVALIAIVGGLGLASTMGLNVMERTREIGILRALGARSGLVRRIVVVEGLILGLLSCVLAIGLAVPLQMLMGQALGQILLYRPLDYILSIPAILIWIVLVTLISLVASLTPAQNAARLTIRETLAYGG